MSNENRIISIAVDPDTEERLKAAAALHAIPVQQYCLDLFQREFRKLGFSEGPLPPRANPVKTAEDLARLFAECDALTRGAPPGGPDSSQLIREAREERMQAIERVVKGCDDVFAFECLSGCRRIPKSKDSKFVPGHDARVSGLLDRVLNGKRKPDDFISPQLLWYAKANPGAKVVGKYTSEDVLKAAEIICGKN